MGWDGIEGREGCPGRQKWNGTEGGREGGKVEGREGGWDGWMDGNEGRD